MSGRGASYPTPPPQIPPCSFPAVGSCRRSNAIEGRSLAAHVPPTRRLAASVTRRLGSESGACVAARLSFDRPPSLHSLRCRFVVGFVRGFIGTTQPSDSSRLPQQLRLLDFLSWPGIALATAGGVRSPRFRRDPFIRDVASDPGRATVPRVTAPHILPSAVATASAPATSRISWLNPTPQMITVYASPWSSPSPTQHSLPGGRYPLPGPDFHRLDRTSFAWRTATPSSQWTFTTYSLPVSRRTHSRCGLHTRTVTVCRGRYPKASDTSSPPCLLRWLPAGAVAGWALHPLEKRRLVTAHVDSRHCQQA